MALKSPYNHQQMQQRFDSMPLTGWFPGHMLKAGRKMHESLRLVDLVVEMLDARAPYSSRNPNFDTILGHKPRCLVLNKVDLADPDQTESWLQFFAQRNENAMILDARRIAAPTALVQEWQAMAMAAEGGTVKRMLQFRPCRIMIAGIPNAGKSTLINQIARKRTAAVGPKPGVTRGHQWVTLPGNTELLDTPGVLWPKIRSKTHELKLALIGSMNEDVMERDMLAEYLWFVLLQQCEKVNWQLYDLHTCPETVEQLMTAVAARRGFLHSGAVDSTRAVVALLKDYRDGKLGRFTLEKP